MSWSVGPVNIKVGDSIIETLDAARVAANPEKQAESYHAVMETHEQVNVALEAVVEIIQSGVLGSTESLTVNMSGHANPKHEKKEGWANDSITINISQTYTQPVTAKE